MVATLFAGTSIANLSHAALFIVSTSAGSGTIQTPGGAQYGDYRDATPSGYITSYSTTQTPETYSYATSTSTASAEIGAVHALSSAQAITNAPGCYTAAISAASAMAEWNDSFIAHIAGVADGTVAKMYATVLMHGAAGGTGTGDFWGGGAWWRSTIGVNGQGWVQSYQFQNNGSWSQPYLSGDGTYGLYHLVADIVLGQAMNAFLRVEAAADVHSGGFWENKVAFESDLGNTVSWAGISSMSVRDTIYDQFSAFSNDTGFDFVKGFSPTTSNVPEPASLSLIGIALLGFGVSRRKK